MADSVYRVLGVPVPDGGLLEEGERVWKVSAFVAGTHLQDLVFGDSPWAVRTAAYALGLDTSGNLRAAHAAAYALREGFAADALLANWDVIGVAFGNPIVCKDGKVYRVDNGSALRRRARGGPKPAGAFTGEVRELYTLRNPRINPSAAWVFSGLPDRDVALQIKGMILPNAARVVGVLPEELRATMEARIEYMAAWAARRLGGA